MDMEQDKRLVMGKALIWIGRLLPFGTAMVILALLVYSFFQAFYYLDDGLRGVAQDGAIVEIDPASPEYGLVRQGDILIIIDDVLITQSYPDYRGKLPGEQVPIVIRRGSQQIEGRLTLFDPPVDEVVRRIIPLLVAVVFWGMAMSVKFFSRTTSNVALIFWVCQAVAALLTAGMLSTLGFEAPSRLFNLLSCLIGPLAVYLHLVFPQHFDPKRFRPLMIGLFGLALVLGIPYLIWGPAGLRARPLFVHWSLINRIFLAFTVLLALVILLYTYYHTKKPGIRWQIRMLTLGGVLSILPVVSLSLLPDILFGQPIIIYQYSFLMLALLPFGYGYIIFRPQLVRIEPYISVGVTYFGVYFIVASLLSLAILAIDRVGFLESSQVPVLLFFLTLVLAGLYVFLSRNIRKAVAMVFYGNWYDLRSVSDQIIREVDHITDLRLLAEAVSSTLVKNIRLQAAAMLFWDEQGKVISSGTSPSALQSQWPLHDLQEIPAEEKSLLSTGEFISKDSLPAYLAKRDSSRQGQRVFQFAQVELWVPVIGHSAVQGVLLVGPRIEGDFYSQEDIQLFHLISHQVGRKAENLALLARLRDHASDLEQRVEERAAQMHDARQRVETILANIGDGVIVISTDGAVLMVNAAFEDISGYTQTELIGKNYRILLHEQNNSSTIDEMREVVQSGASWRGELVARAKDGHTYDINITIAPLRDQDGQISGYVASQRDITRLKRIEKLKDHFIADISHELRTPISNICLYMDLLENAPPASQPQYLAVLKEQSRLLKAMAESMFDLNSLMAEKDRCADMQSISLNSIVHELVDTYQSLARSANLEMVFNLSSGLPRIQGDPKQLARLISNLLTNAIRYTPQGEVQVRTLLRDSRVCLEIQDTGIGIDTEDMPFLFDRFYRGRNARQTDSPGTGLGLAIVKEIVDLHQGAIKVDSEVGKGSLFMVEFPLSEE
ncbi:MAG: PAS domain S-box protein [Anaerolineales bacterium]|nr:PAS domain S-box protein [Anaerolineales bacterium]